MRLSFESVNDVDEESVHDAAVDVVAVCVAVIGSPADSISASVMKHISSRNEELGLGLGLGLGCVKTIRTHRKFRTSIDKEKR